MCTQRMAVKWYFNETNSRRALEDKKNIDRNRKIKYKAKFGPIIADKVYKI